MKEAESIDYSEQTADDVVVQPQPQNQKKKVRNKYALSAIIMVGVYVVLVAIMFIGFFSMQKKIPDFDYSAYENMPSAAYYAAKDAYWAAFDLIISKIQIFGFLISRFMILTAVTEFSFSLMGLSKSAILRKGSGLSLLCIILGIGMIGFGIVCPFIINK